MQKIAIFRIIFAPNCKYAQSEDSEIEKAEPILTINGKKYPANSRYAFMHKCKFCKNNSP
jgi:predicted secreted Zn-dependent protease